MTAPLSSERHSITRGLIFLVFFLSGLGVSAQRPGVNVAVVPAVLSGTSEIVANATAVQTHPYNSGNYIRNVITLKVNEETDHYIASDFTASVRIKIEYGDNSTSLQSPVYDTLTVSYKKDEGVKYAAKHYVHFEKAHYVKVTVQSLDTTSAVPSTPFLALENRMEVITYPALQNAVPGTFTLSPYASDELVANWSWPTASGNTHTQLEWTWVETGMDGAYRVNNVLDTSLLFKAGATRVEVGYNTNEYRIPILYGEGKVYARIRVISYGASGTRQDGKWSWVEYESITAHQDSLNWQSTTSFAEEGKRKTVIQYYDGSLRSRQTVTKENVGNTIVTAETFYDGQGRPAVQILPTPGMSSIIAYTRNLNKFNGQGDNADPARYFDLQPASSPNSATLPMDTTMGASKYYSTQNARKDSLPDKHIPHAEGYPYTVTRYTPDATGRIMAQSGVGAAMRLGKGHETKYYYGTAAQEELDALFGTEVGVYIHYFKNMVRDANGQMSVSYVDMHGRTIATALTGSTPPALQALAPDSNYITRNLLDPATNVVKGNAIESVNSLLVPVPTLYQFRYELQPQTLQLAACGTTSCYDCMYDLEIAITEESGEGISRVRRYTNVNANADRSCSTGVQGWKDSLGNTISGNVIIDTVTLLEGSYRIRKTLTLSESSLHRYRKMYMDSALCKTEQQLIDSVYTALLVVSDCGNPQANTLNCDTCYAQLGSYGTYRAAYIASSGYPADSGLLERQIRASYEQERKTCERLCNTTSQLMSSKRSAMLRDMMPYTGQYAEYQARKRADSVVTWQAQSMFRRYNIFSDSVTVTRPFYKYPKDTITVPQPGYYRTSAGYIDKNIHPDSNYTKLHATSKDEFRTAFVPSWAEGLLPYHPEYPKLKFAEDSLGPTYNWIHRFNNTTTYQKASDSGYLFTSSTSSIGDPFYAFVADSLSAMATKVGSSYVQGLSMWQLAYGDVKCKMIVDPMIRSGCYNGAPKYPTTSNGFDSLSTAEKDQAWLVFRGLYASVRDGHVNTYINLRRPNADAQVLIDAGYLLHFPGSNAQMAQQYGSGWSWMPASPGAAPVLTGLPSPSTPTAVYQSRCESYITNWKASLLQCPALANHIYKDSILTVITNAMVQVCKKGTDGANAFGSSTVAPSTPVNTGPRSFEAIIDSVFAAHSILKTNLCNPYMIEYPKPYGKGPVMVREMMAGVDTCNCTRYTKLKQEATAGNYNPAVRSSFNQFLQSKYGDTLSQSLFDTLNVNCPKLGKTVCKDSTYQITVPNDSIPCNCYSPYRVNSTLVDSVTVTCTLRYCDTTSTTLILKTPTVYPQFLKCGSGSIVRCINCAELWGYVQEFKQKVPSPYNIGPVFTGNLGSDTIRSNVLFAKFVNYRTGLQYGWTDYAKKAGQVGCAMDSTSAGKSTLNVICADTRPLTDTAGLFVRDTACHKTRLQAIALGQQIYQQRKDSLLQDFERKYREKCLAAASLEEFEVSYGSKEYHYTLYYYDQAGSLVKTVPPKGVVPNYNSSYLASVKASRGTTTRVVPAHTLVTNYRYNSLGQVVKQETPDGGTSRFWYDKLGRLVVSQNAEQKLTDKYSYTLYDSLGRITEVGEKQNTEPMSQTTSQSPTSLATWIGSADRTQLTTTVYDQPYGASDTYPDGILAGQQLNQRNLRNRVSYSMTQRYPGDTLHIATFYTYDIHGNVDTLLQDMKAVYSMKVSGNRFKRISYTYDLISGKVNTVSYQPGKADAFYHRYYYDAENRLTEAWTSRDKIVWERDAAYKYYKHGPLARTELGQLRVQGMDYAYTIHGWLKGINSTVVGDGSHDIGRDGALTTGPSPVARDVIGLSLHYFDQTDGSETFKDYSPIGNLHAFARPNSTSGFASLYNGNIGAISMNNQALAKGGSSTNAAPLFYKYGYDQLNRLVKMDAYTGLDASANTWTSTFTSINDYQERISYDPNGNILKYKRNGAPALGSSYPMDMDSLTYEYYADKNQLKRVRDAVSASNYTASSTNKTRDLDHQDSTENYVYDKIGNLVKDKKDSLTSVSWSVYGKILSITKPSGTTTYQYDAMGNRIMMGRSSDTTVYLRDATGNVMSVYTWAASTNVPKVTETHLYGSSRLGIIKGDTTTQKTITLASNFGVATRSYFIRGERAYELTNHLGNVLATISDKKIQHNASGWTDYYTADVISATDYYPFGMQMPGRNYSSPKYRYGFNGKENDNDIKGDGNQQDYGFRIYDPRLGKFLSVDPLTKDYPWYTPYQFAGNKPIEAIDLDGAEEKFAVNTDFRIQYKPVIEAPNTGTALNNSAHNAISFVWNSTAGTVFEGGKEVWNTVGETVTGTYKPKSSWERDPVGAFNRWTEEVIEYFTESSTSQKAKDFGEAATCLDNYEIIPQLVIAHKLPGTSPAVPEAMADDAFLAAKARVFEAGGSIGILGGQGELTISSLTKRLTGELTINNKSVFIEGKISTENGILSIKDLGIRNKSGNYNNTDLVGEIGFEAFKNILEELKVLREKGGYKSGEIEFERLRPESSKLPDSEKRVINF